MRVKRFTISLVASLVLAIIVSAPAVAQMDDRQAMMDLVIQIQQLQDEVRMLRGMAGRPECRAGEPQQPAERPVPGSGPAYYRVTWFIARSDGVKQS